ncbi:hypothetical protein, partial [Rhodoferax sp.]|uniref:hypothetical protein n=1 Tax=Rhodoferax sp. TaxID=50421 RepID=UPI00275DB5DF|nr:hypothetical protein [Rhodoferax sp.]
DSFMAEDCACATDTTEIAAFIFRRREPGCATLARNQSRVQQWIDEWLRSAKPVVRADLPGPWRFVGG